MSSATSTEPPAETGLRLSTDLAALGRTLTAAFWDDPVLSWIFPRELARREPLMEAFFQVTTAMMLDHDGGALVTPDHTAVVVYTPPGRPNLTPEQNASFQDELARATGECGARSVEFLRLLEDNEPSELPPHVHIMYAAVDPAHQVRVAGARLAEHFCDRFDRDEIGIYAEASSPASYTRWRMLGARPVGARFHLPDGPPLFPVWRPPPGERRAPPGDARRGSE